MTTDLRTARDSAHRLAVYAARDFAVTDGVNLGDNLTEAPDLVPDDIYGLARGAGARHLALRIEGPMRRMTVAEGSECGTPGARVVIDCCATFMAPDGSTVDALVLVELDRAEAHVAAVWMLPLAPLAEKTDYALVNVDRDCGAERFAELACVSFARGTRITLATGEQRPIEELNAGDLVLTRNHGVRPIRWIGRRTQRATGVFAPIVIRKGALNNAGDLLLAPSQRVFIYQRKDLVGAGRREVLVRADMLVNGKTVERGDGGFVEYFELLFDDHEIVYAEGIATESLPPDARAARPGLPQAVQDKLGARRGPRRSTPPAATLSEGMIDSASAAEILRRASRP